MRVDLIHPSLEKSDTYTGVEGPIIAGLSLTALAAVTPEWVKLRIVDERIEDLDFTELPDLVGITFMTRLAHRAYWIASEYQKRGVPVVLGGIHPTVRPVEAVERADAVVVGEAEELWPMLLEDFQKGNLKKIYKNNHPPSLKNLSFPRRDLLQKNKYKSINTIEATRGCPHRCSFCYGPAVHMNSFRTKPVDNVVRDIETINGRELIFIDDNIIGNHQYAKELFSAMIPFKRWWFSQCTIKIADDDELLNLAVKSGCRVLLIGFETLSNANLRRNSKKWSLVEHYRTVIQKLHNKGIAIIASFIVGFEDDDRDVFEVILNFCIDNQIEFMQVNPLSYFPGTDLYDTETHEGKKKGRLTSLEWWKEPFPYVYKVHYNHPRLSPDELENGCVWLMKQFYSIGSIIQRSRKASIPMLFYYWIINLGLKNIGSTLPVEGYNPKQDNSNMTSLPDASSRIVCNNSEDKNPEFEETQIAQKSDAETEVDVV